jgi:hypothetical protein
MLIRDLKRLVPLVVVPLIFIFVFLRFYEDNLIKLPFQSGHRQESKDGKCSISFQDAITRPNDDFGMIDSPNREVFSVSTVDKKYFMIEFGSYKAINPNIIPHPALEDTWVIVAQHHNRRNTVKNSVWFSELVCNASFNNGTLSCNEPPVTLPIAATPNGDKCQGKYEFFKLSIGPHDARVFFGPNAPYTIYGSNAVYTCFGQWMLDFRLLLDWGLEHFNEGEFRQATELQRPLPYRPVEKNWFIFWDSEEQMYAHYDVAPKRSFAKLGRDGSVGPDLASLVTAHDEKCMAVYGPKVTDKSQLKPEDGESIHQATNSLSITLCKRSDPSCKPNDFNTLIFTIFQHKGFYNYHSVYAPYVMLFHHMAPFGIYGISTKPLWIHGRGGAGEGKQPDSFNIEGSGAWKQTEMFYITSMSWKTHGQKYHGYMDDVLFLAFGIEDAQTAGIDVVAGDLLLDLGLCADL